MVLKYRLVQESRQECLSAEFRLGVLLVGAWVWRFLITFYKGNGLIILSNPRINSAKGGFTTHLPQHFGVLSLGEHILKQELHRIDRDHTRGPL